jgi:hypothetical protein
MAYQLIISGSVKGEFDTIEHAVDWARRFDVPGKQKIIRRSIVAAS